MHQSNTMISYVLIACFAAAVLGVPHPPKARVAGSHDVNIQQYPYHVQLHQPSGNGENDTWFLKCNGAIISPKHVLTTAKCINPYINSNVDPSSILVKVNASVIYESDEQTQPTFVKVKNFTLHPLHSNKNDIVTVDFNIGVLELAEPLQFGPGIQPIGLPKPNEYAAIGSVLSVTGFGAKYNHGSLDVHGPLQALQVVVVDNMKCSKDFIGDAIVTDRQICTDSVLGNQGEGPCYGDDGSPAAFEGILHGLYTFGDCGLSEHGSVYTNVAAFVEFVNDAIAASN